MIAKSATHSAWQIRRKFAQRLAMFYGTVFGSSGFYLPFFPVWLKAIGIDPTWIGAILAVPSMTRFTTLPFITAFAERRHALRQTMIVCAFLTMIGFATVGMLREPLGRAPGVRADGGGLDAAHGVDRWLCAERRGALRLQLRSAAAVGLGGFRGWRARLRSGGQLARRSASDLGDCCSDGAVGCRQPWSAAIGRADRRRHGALERQARCYAIPASSPSRSPPH